MSDPSPSDNRFERHSGKVTTAVVFLLLALAFAAIEWLLTPRGSRHASRALSDSPAPGRHLVMREWKRDTDYLYAPPPARGLYKDAGYSSAYKLSTDRDGFILPSARHAKPDVEIVFLGGSTTECMFVTPEKRFPNLTALQLEQSLGFKINGINAGRSGNTTMHANALLLAKVLPRRPDFVVLMEAVNDMGVLGRDGYWTPSGGQRLVESDRVSVADGATRIVKALVPYTFAALLQAKRVLLRQRPVEGAATPEAGSPKHGAPPAAAPARAAVSTGSLPEAWLALGRDFEASLRTFTRMVSAWGAQPVLMTQVRVRTRTEAERHASFLRQEKLGGAGLNAEGIEVLHERFNDLVRKVATEEKAVLIDLARGHDWRFGDVYDEIHFTDLGSEKVAGLISTALRPLIAGRVQDAGRGSTTTPEGGMKP